MSLSILLLGTSKIEHELQNEIELSNPRLINGPLSSILPDDFENQSISLISRSQERRENGGTKLRTTESDTLLSSSPRFAPRISDRSGGGVDIDDDTFFHYLHLTDLFLDDGEFLDLCSLLKKWSSS